MISFIIDGDPVGKGRPRLTTRGGYAHAYTPSKTLEYEKQVKEAFKMQCGGIAPYGAETPLEVRITAFVRIPKSTPKKTAMRMEFGDVRPAKKPDVDNIAKTILDALNGLAYQDDKQVVALVVDKYYTGSPFTKVVIREARG